MKRTIVKLSVIASSVMLAAGFISYRAGAFDWLTPVGVQPADPVTDSSDSAQPLPAIMSGSKSSFSYPVTGSAGSQSSNTPPPVIMSGSKSLAPLIPSTPSKPADQAPAQSQTAKPDPK